MANSKIDIPGKPLEKSTNQFPVVGIGASAGGLEAFKRFLRAISEDSGMAYVLVQHLDPKHNSLLPELLQKVTKIPVVEISDEVKVEPNHIYVIPSNKMMIANNGVLQLTPRPAIDKNSINLPINLFFASLAEVHQSFAIGIVLSGTGSDGTKGLKTIKAEGGITFAQDNESAGYNGMPQSAIDAEVVDFVLPPEKMPEKLMEVVKNISLTDQELDNFPPQDSVLFKKIITLLGTRKGTDFTYYKQTTISRRILRRMALSQSNELTEYYSFLTENKHEQDALYQDMLIPVTEFFRDPKVFENLSESVFPQLLKNKGENEPIRIWVAGCSTGEEAYSIAICLKEYLGDIYPSERSEDKKEGAMSAGVQIFATDLSEPAILKARSGIYKKSDIEGMSAQRIQRYFTKTNGNYQIIKEIRQLCIFTIHNFLKDPPFGKMDLVSCRNVMIYMEPYLQKKALTTFHYALNSKGFLLLGKSETGSTSMDLFTPTGKNNKLFIRKDVPGKFMQVTSQRSEQSLLGFNKHVKSETRLTDFKKAAEEIILSKYTPSGVIVNEDLDIVHFRGVTTDFLGQSPGKPSHNLLNMAKNGLGFELRNILHKAKKENTTVIKKQIPLQGDSGQRNINIEAIPLTNSVEPHFLVLFHETGNEGNKKPKGNKKVSISNTDEKDFRIKQLEEELYQTREDMRSITEDQEAANEELQTANEELLSGSEELQSLNEELETSKEELQSTNEELIVVNQEMVSLNEKVTSARNYAESIIATIREPLLVLDKNLRVKSGNDAFYRTFKLTEKETEGMLIYELYNKQWCPPVLKTNLQAVLPENENFFDVEVNHHFPNIGNRTMMMNAREMEGEIGGEKFILLVIEDITDRIKHQMLEFEFLSRFQNLIMYAPVAICILRGDELIVELANDFYLNIIEKSKDFIEKPFFESLPELEVQGFKDLLLNVMKTGLPYYGTEVEMFLNRPEKREQCFFNFVYNPIIEMDGSVVRIIIVVTEITEQVLARKRMEAQATMVRNILMSSPGFVCTLNGPHYVYDIVNDQYQKLFGKRQLVGIPMMKALPELKGQGLDKILDKVYSTGEPFVGIDVPITVARDENLKPELRYFNFSYQPVYDENNKINSVIVFGYEVTEQVLAKERNLAAEKKHAKALEEKVMLRTYELSEANQSLKQKNDELINKNKELEAFAYVSSHDLQEPLRKIQTFAGRILDTENDNLSVRGKDYFARMQSSARRMQQLIEDLLAFSKIGQGERTFVKTDIKTIIDEVKSDFRDVLKDKKATLEVKKTITATIIPFQFRQMMHNLVGNSLKFLNPEIPLHIVISGQLVKWNKLEKKHSIDIVLAKGAQLADKDYCYITVNDNGIGFEAQFQDKIFEVFQRLHNKDTYEGTGIGLAIVKKIVENHQGFIYATGVLNKGATFHIYLPNHH